MVDNQIEFGVMKCTVEFDEGNNMFVASDVEIEDKKMDAFRIQQVSMELIKYEHSNLDLDIFRSMLIFILTWIKQ